jgi:putative PEP-CTERM system histidine kinase
MWAPGPAATLSLTVAVLVCVAAAALMVRARGRAFQTAVGGCLGLSGLAQAVGSLGLRGEVPDTTVLCLGLVIELLQPAGLFWVSAVVVGAPGSEERAQARRRAGLVLVACGVFMAFAWTSTTLQVALAASGAPVVALGPLGRVVFGAHVLLLAFGMAQFEAILRAVRYPLRYSLKYYLPALAAPAVYQIYFSSQILLLGSAPLDRTLASVVLMTMALMLLVLGLRIEQAAEVGPVYVSPRIVYGSVTFLVIGLYLLAVGAVGELIRQSWPGVGVGLSEAMVLLALLGLAVALLSRSAQAEMRRFVSRHFYRSKYDYREKWLEVTDAFENCTSAEQILDRLLDLVSRTFGSGRISIWMRFEADARFHEVRSVNLEAPPQPLGEDHPLVAALREAEGSLVLGAPAPAAAEAPEIAAFREQTRTVLAAPIRMQRELSGFVALGPERGGEAYETDDRTLLRAIVHHAGVLLSQARMAEERRDAAELEALHRVSAFCVHDLKNLAASLSLVARNSETHGKDPAFQESALKTVARTAGKIMDLVHRLSRRSPAPVPVSTPVDLDSAIEDTLASLSGGVREAVVRIGARPPLVAMTRDEAHQLLLNLFLLEG